MNKTKRNNSVICMVLILFLLLPAHGSASSPAKTAKQTTSQTPDIFGTSCDIGRTSTELAMVAESALNKKPASATEIDLATVKTIKDLENAIENQVETAIQSLNDQWDALSKDINSYKEYLKNVGRVSAFYETVINETKNICILLREDSIIYANMIMASDMSSKNKYRAVDDLNDCIYEGACDDVKDDIYDRLLDKMKDYYYDGILEDAMDSANYSEWYDAYSDEYSQWYDTSSEVYSEWYDTCSDIYGFYSALSSDMYDRDTKAAYKRIAKFSERTLKAKNKLYGLVDNSISPEFCVEVVAAASAEDLETVIETQIADCVLALEHEWKALSVQIDTYDKYLASSDQVEAFYENIVDKTTQVLVLIREYSTVYADVILDSDATNKEKYAGFKDILDCTYEDACKAVVDDIYDGILKDMKRYYYDGILEDAKDNARYSEWSSARSDEYGWWSDARGDVYSEWSDARSDLYSFISGARGELYSGDIDDAKDDVLRFKAKIAKMK